MLRGWLCIPVPAMAARSSPSVDTFARSSCTSCSPLGLVRCGMLQLISVVAPGCFGASVTPVDSEADTGKEAFSAAHPAVTDLLRPG